MINLYHVVAVGHKVAFIGPLGCRPIFSVPKMDGVKGDREMAQCINVLATKRDNLSTILRIHMVGREAACPLTLTHMHPYTQRQQTPTHKHAGAGTRTRARTHTELINKCDFFFKVKV